MDFFDERVLAALRDGKPKDFTKLLEEVGFSHNTLQQHLKQLVDKSLVLKEKDSAKGFGRPRYVYNVPSKTAKQLISAIENPDVELVTLPFSRVRHVCRFEKGGWCKMKKAQCSPQICPQIRK